MYVAILRESLQWGVLDRWRGSYGGHNIQIMFGLEKYDLVREKSGNFYCLVAGNPDLRTAVSTDQTLGERPFFFALFYSNNNRLTTVTIPQGSSTVQAPTM